MYQPPACSGFALLLTKKYRRYGALLLATLVTYLFEKPLARLFLRGEKKRTGDVSCQPVHPQTEDEA